MAALATRPVPTTKLKNILFATDFSDASMHALPYIAGMARKLGSSVYLCHVVVPSPLVLSAPEAAPSLYEAMRNQATTQLAALTHSPELRDIEAKTLVGEGAIGDALPNLVAENKIDLIVMGTQRENRDAPPPAGFCGRSGLSRRYLPGTDRRSGAGAKDGDHV
jgi:nucleotide-binding universal stress UspA family protein